MYVCDKLLFEKVDMYSLYVHEYKSVAPGEEQCAASSSKALLTTKVDHHLKSAWMFLIRNLVCLP